MTSDVRDRSDAGRTPDVSAGRAGFGQLVRAEWIKFRSVRGWVIGMVVAALLTVLLGVFLGANANIGCESANGKFQSGKACEPTVPIGPGGEAVNDSYYLESKPLTGNGSITVRLTSLTSLHVSGNGQASPGQNPTAGMQRGIIPWSKGGIILTPSIKRGSAYAAIMATGEHGIQMQYDYTSDIAGLPGAVKPASPRWLRLTRNGDAVRGYDSADGRHWTLVGTATLAGLPATVRAGMFVTSPQYVVTRAFFGGASNAVGPSQSTAVFDDLSLRGDWPATAWTGDDIGAHSATPDTGFGYAHHRGGTFTVSGSGDIAPVTSGGGGFPSADFEQPLMAIFVALIAIVVVAAAFFTSEYRRGLIRVTLAASPRRSRVLAAKAVVIGSVAFVTGLVASVAAIWLGLPREENQGILVLPVPLLTEVRVIVGTALLVGVAAVLATAIGAIVRRSAVAVTTAIVVIVLPFLLSVIALPAGIGDWVLRLAPAAGLAIQQSIPNYPFVQSTPSAGSGTYPLSPWAGFAVLCAWAIAALWLASILLRRRDA